MQFCSSRSEPPFLYLLDQYTKMISTPKSSLQEILTEIYPSILPTTHSYLNVKRAQALRPPGTSSAVRVYRKTALHQFESTLRFYIFLECILFRKCICICIVCLWEGGTEKQSSDGALFH